MVRLSSSILFLRRSTSVWLFCQILFSWNILCTFCDLSILLIENYNQQKPSQPASLFHTANNVQAWMEQSILFIITCQHSSIMKHSHTFQLIQPTNGKSTFPHLLTRYLLPNINIFLETVRQRVSQQELQQSKSYEVVGLKELKSYKNRGKKRSKIAFKEEQTTERSISRESNRTKKKTKIDLLSKEEVIEALPRLAQEFSLHHLKSTQTESWIDQFTKDHGKAKGEMKRVSRQFSVQRLKNRISQHQKQWKRIFKDRGEQKFPSLDQSITQFQTKLQDLSNKPLNEDLVNIRSSFWTSTLRNSKQISQLCSPEKQVKTIHNQGVKALGSSKLASETDWIHKKQEQGFKFKTCVGTNGANQRVKSKKGLR